MNQYKKIFDHFICIWMWFLSLFVFMFSAYMVFHCLNMFCVVKQVSKFFAAHLRLTRQSRNFSRLSNRETPVTSSSRSFRNSLATRENFRDTKCLETAFLRAFRGKLVLNLSHPLLNPSFNIFTSKPNQFEWFFIPLTSLR